MNMVYRGVGLEPYLKLDRSFERESIFRLVRKTREMTRARFLFDEISLDNRVAYFQSCIRRQLHNEQEIALRMSPLFGGKNGIAVPPYKFTIKACKSGYFQTDSSEIRSFLSVRSHFQTISIIYALHGCVLRSSKLV